MKYYIATVKVHHKITMDREYAVEWEEGDQRLMRKEDSPAWLEEYTEGNWYSTMPEIDTFFLDSRYEVKEINENLANLYIAISDWPILRVPCYKSSVR